MTAVQIKASCPLCGEVDLSPGDVSLYCSLGSQDENAYTFMCPRCRTTVTKQADRTIARLLMDAGVRWAFRRGRMTARPTAGPPPQRVVTAPLTYDDLLDLLLAMQGNDFLSDLAAA